MTGKDLGRRYGNLPVMVRSPGRINLIGEHTDYNGGLVLPAAINRYIEVSAGLHPALIRIYSCHFDEEVMITPDEIIPRSHHWSTYVLGIVHQLAERGFLLGGFNMIIKGDIPPGAGLSSSAALECAVCKALDELFELHLDAEDIIRIAQAAEHAFAGVHCGIMDMFASVHGKKDHALLLDCRSMHYEEVPLELQGHRIILFNSNVKHSLASSTYNRRRDECAEGLHLVQRHEPWVRNLRDVTRDMLIQYVHDPVIHQRCRYVIEENARVLRAVECMKAGNIRGLGELLYRSHEGLTHDYDVSCPELDWLVASVRHRRYVAGARMMGGGFGGCTINLVKENFIEKLTSDLTDTYERFMGITLTFYEVRVVNGTEVLTPTAAAL